jgi:hypothetical protein
MTHDPSSQQEHIMNKFGKAITQEPLPVLLSRREACPAEAGFAGNQLKVDSPTEFLLCSGPYHPRRQETEQPARAA